MAGKHALLPRRSRRPRRKSAVRLDRADGQTVHESEFAVLDTKEMRIGDATGPSHEADNRTKLRVCDEAAIRELHAARHADIAAIVRLATSRANAAFEAVARRAPWHLHIVVV